MAWLHVLSPVKAPYVKKVSRFLWGFLVIGTLLSYASVWVSPLTFQWSGFVSLLIPVFLIINFILLLLQLFIRPKRALVPLLLVLIGFRFITASIAVGSSNSEEGLKVLNYNINRVNIAANQNLGMEMVDWLANVEADVKCFQEFLNRPLLVNALSKELRYSYIDGYAGSYAIFSKYPIVNSGKLYEDKRKNNILFADLVVNRDTIRVYNVHLQSMAINVDDVVDSERLKERYQVVGRKFGEGSVTRARQVKELIAHASNSSYPTILTGDFNDIPYSFNYMQLAAAFDNAFEHGGRGFGFTYNGKLPFLRIDNQFFSEGIAVNKFETLSDIKYSDHHPVLGIYSLSD